MMTQDDMLKMVAAYGSGLLSVALLVGSVLIGLSMLARGSDDAVGGSRD